MQKMVMCSCKVVSVSTLIGLYFENKNSSLNRKQRFFVLFLILKLLKLLKFTKIIEYL